MSAVSTTAGRDPIRDIVLDRAELEADVLDETSLFLDDYGLTSMVIVEIQAAIEMEYDIVMTSEQSRRMVNLAAVREVFAEASAGMPERKGRPGG
jgi:acyl carrier protein